MKLTRLITRLGFIACAGAFTAGLFFLDAQRGEIHDTVASLKWTRQVASQAEGLALAERERGVVDPVGAAAAQLSQGVEPRVMRITKSDGGAGAETEFYHLDRAQGLFEYTKIFTPETGEGVRIRVAVPYAGFLGTRSKALSDIATAAVFAGSLLILLLLGAGRRAPAEAADPEVPRLRELVIDWLREGKVLLTQLGIHIREMVREAQNLAIAAGKSRNAMSELRDRIHAEIREVREARQALREAEQDSIQAEVAALNLVIEAARLGAEGQHLGGAAEQLYQRVQKLRKLNERNAATIGRIEIQLEPWATDADLAYQSYDDVFRASQGMDSHIRRTTETLLGQAKAIQGLNEKLSTPAAAPPVAAPGRTAEEAPAPSAPRAARPPRKPRKSA